MGVERHARERKSGINEHAWLIVKHSRASDSRLFSDDRLVW